jgi:cysteinyl-tRNA synthetase
LHDPVVIRLFNTLTRSEEEFRPLRDDIVRMYTCGLTVYARGHIGNFRSFLSQDILRRALRHQEGYGMRHVRNFTDVDDKTINGAIKAGMSLNDYTTQWITAFEEDAAALGLEPVEESPRATDPANMQAMGDMVRALIARGHTYEVDGSIYFRIASFPDYGRLARLDTEGMQAGARVDNDTYDKQDARDFVLWKATKPGEPTWDVGTGPGRPGWHLECSAMALRLLGEPPIDIHCGGIDLIFPHHENEIAQAEGATGKPFARFWVHTEFLNLDNEKMSKSLGNVFNVRDILDKGYRASALRYLLISVHYRKQLTFGWDGLDQAEASLTRLGDFLARLDMIKTGEAHAAITERVTRARDEFRAHISADLNVPGALGVLFELVRDMHAAMDAGHAGAPDAATIRVCFDDCDRVLGVLSLRRAEDERPPVPVEEIEALIAARRDAKRARKFDRADQIRADLEARGIQLEDSATGTRWKRARAMGQ